MSDDYGQTLAAFVLDTGKQSRRLLKRLQEIDDVDPNVQIVDAAIADRSRFRVKVHQTVDRGGAKGAARGATLGVVVGAIIAGPAGAVVGGAAVGVLNGVHNRLHDVGIDDKFMRQVTKELDHGKSALFILYEGNWSGSIGLIEQAISTDKALLISSTMEPAKAAALKALVDPTVEQLGGAEVVADYEMDVAEAEPAEEAPLRKPPRSKPPRTRQPLRPPTRMTSPNSPVSVPRPAPRSRRRASRPMRRSPTPTSRRSGTRSTRRTWRRPPTSGRGRCRPAMPTRGDWQGLMKYNKRTSEPAHHAATKSKAKAAPPDDLTQLNGIGPRISSILSDGGVTTYDELEHSDPSELRKIIAAGGALPPSSLDSWPTQASYATPGRLAGPRRATTTASSVRPSGQDRGPPSSEGLFRSTRARRLVRDAPGSVTPGRRLGR